MPATFQRARSWWGVTTSTMRNPESWKLSWSVNQVLSLLLLVFESPFLFVVGQLIKFLSSFLSVHFTLHFILLLWFFKSAFVYSRFGTLYLQKVILIVTWVQLYLTNSHLFDLVVLLNFDYWKRSWSVNQVSFFIYLLFFSFTFCCKVILSF